MEKAQSCFDDEHGRQALEEYARHRGVLLPGMELITVILDCDSNIAYANEFLLNLAGLAPEDVIGRHWIDSFIPGDRRDEVGEVFDQMIVSGGPAWYESDILVADGDIRTVRFHNSFLRDGPENIIGVLSIGEDITERKQIRDNELYGEERLLGSVSRLGSAPPADVPGLILADVLEFSGGALRDDVAILAVARGDAE